MLPDDIRDTAVTTLLHTIHQQIHDLLGQQCVGMYVHGSLALGDFNPDRSDIDFVVVTAVPLTPTQQQQIATMHTRLYHSGQPWANHLEASYIPRAALRRYDPTDNRHPALRIDGTFANDTHGPDWIIQRHILREHGIVLAGPRPATLIDPIAPAALRHAAIATLHDWWEPILANPAYIGSREYEAYAVLTMCRILYTAAHSNVTGKSTAARWAIASLPGRWTPLIQQAVAWPHEPQTPNLPEVLNFIRYTLAHAETAVP